MADSGRRVARHYELGAQLGAGRAGRVFAARDLRTGAAVAVKLRSVTDDSRLDVESAGLRQLEHPNLLRVLDAGVDGEGTFIVTELVDGGTLDAVAKPLAADVLKAFSSQMLDALAFLHANGILHGDIKTENVLVAAFTPPQFKLSDFGLAHRSVDIAAGTTRGSPAFMPPEIIRGEPADERSDLYSLGVTLYECAFGELPFDNADLRKLLLRHLTEVPIRLQDPGNVDPRLVALLSRLLAKDPASRPADARAALALWRGDAAAAPRWVPPRLGVLIGREAEFARLEESFASDSAAIGIEGPSGLGKTRLLQELGIRLELRGVQIASWTPQGLLGVELESDSGTTEDPETDLKNDPHFLTESRTREVLEQLGEPPWVLIVDDVDAAPSWFVEAVSAVIREVTGAGGKYRLICVAGRETGISLVREALEAGGFPALDGIRFGPWSKETLESAASALLGARRLHSDLVMLLDAATAGIPGEVEAACQQLAEKNLLRIDTQGALTIAAETTAQDILDPRNTRATEQLAQCDAQDLQLLRILAILHAPATVSFLETFQSHRSFAELRQRGLVNISQSTGNTVVWLAHEGIRAAILKSLIPQVRRSLHDQVAVVLERDPALAPGEVMTLHRAAGSDLNIAREAVSRMAAAPQAELRPEMLGRAYEYLLELWPRTDTSRDRFHVVLANLDTKLRLGQFEEVNDRVLRLLETNGPNIDSQALRNRQAQSLLYLGKSESAIELLSDDAPGPSGTESRVLRAQILSNLGRHEEVLQVIDLISQDAETTKATLVDLRATSLNALGLHGKATELLRDSIRTFETQGAVQSSATLMLRLSRIEFYQGKMREAESTMDHALRSFCTVGDRRGMLRALNNLAAVYGETGRHAKALEQLRVALDLCRRLGESDSLSFVLANLAQHLLTLGRYREAMEYADEAITIGTRRNLVTSMILSQIVRGGILAALGLEHLCHTELSSIRGIVSGQVYEGQILLLWSDLGLRGSHTADVAGWLTRAREVLRSVEADDELIRLDLQEARLLSTNGDRDRAIRTAQSASSRSRELNTLTLTVEAETLLAELCVDSDPTQAQAIAQAALEDASTVGLPECTWRLQRIVGRTAFLKGDLVGALAGYRSSIQGIQALCENVPPDHLDSYLDHPDRIRVFEESSSIRLSTST